ncbi:DUF4255 domain-containing protein [Streptomyces tagetis]|uniref:DUF4255 domain-containing protein n=1 Tax=Streptomyces tagetis TaxID=2820809 RepID=A0A941B1Y3_9ACTN|nr:DUF4255 domain-containing protein [Streptomyces sp. RG38]MBQ0826632.1 DUF4255 domain-containing protein [Streptomyces sp. RG38]
MAGFSGVSAVGRSLERLLNLAFISAQPVPGESTKAVLIRTDDLDLAQNTEIRFPALSLLLYRVDFDKSTRASWSARGSQDGRSYLPLDLHYLLTPWADNAEHEHLILGRTLQALDDVAVLSGPLLDHSGEWEPDEGVQLLLEDVSMDDLMRTFEALSVDFRLSLPYVARVVVVTGPSVAPPADTLTVVTGARL